MTQLRSHTCIVNQNVDTIRIQTNHFRPQSIDLCNLAEVSSHIVGADTMSVKEKMLYEIRLMLHMIANGLQSCCAEFRLNRLMVITVIT
jgi:hypothetical protein